MVIELTVGIENIIITNNPTKKTIDKFDNEKEASIFNPNPSIYLSQLAPIKNLTHRQSVK